MATMKDKILQRFLQAGGQPISGQQLANDFGVSRTAIWKHLQALQEEGYTFETLKKKGYVLKGEIDVLSEAALSVHLQTARLGHVMHHYEQLESTQVVAHELVRANTPDGTVVIAEEQTKGRGRMLRPWDSTAHKGIWMTVILKPDVLPHQAPQFTLVSAVAVVAALKEVAGIEAKIKWPNDILLNGKKCTGILTEMVAETDRVQALLIGIGINVNHEEADFPEELQTIATSVKQEVGEVVDRARLAASLLKHLEHYSDLYVEQGFAPIKGLWEEASATLGRRVRATTSREVIEGEAVRITDSGVLEIRTDDGEIRGVYSADIELT